MDVNVEVQELKIGIEEKSIRRLENLSDVDVSSAENGQVLFHEDGVWKSGTPVIDGAVEWDSVLNKPLEFPSETHTHAIEEVVGLDEALDEKLDATLAFSGDFEDLSNVPQDFAPSPHTHEIEDIEGLDEALFTWSYNDLTDVPASFTPANHSHGIADVTGLQSALNNKQDAATAFDGDYDSLTNLPTLFEGDYNELYNKPTLFDGDYNSLSNRPDLFDGDYTSLSNIPSTFTPAVHSHTIGEVTGLQSAIDAVGVVPNQSGGTDGRVVRMTATDDTWTNASRADTLNQLASLAFKQGGEVYTYGAVISGLSGLVAGSVYYLSTSGNITTTAPTPSSSTALVKIGTAINTTTLYFTPGIPIGGE